jgi:hypothetical protein
VPREGFPLEAGRHAVSCRWLRMALGKVVNFGASQPIPGVRRTQGVVSFIPLSDGCPGPENAVAHYQRAAVFQEATNCNPMNRDPTLPSTSMIEKRNTSSGERETLSLR